MTMMLDLTIKMTAVLLAALFLAWCWRSRSAAVRHWVLTVSLASAAMVPLLGLVVPAWRVPMWAVSTPRTATPAAASAQADVATAQGQQVIALSDDAVAGLPAANASASSVEPLDAASLLLWIWLGGIAACLGVLLVGFSRLQWIASRSTRIDEGPWSRVAADIGRRYGLSRQPALLQSDHPSFVVTWGLVRPQVLLPSGAGTWPEERIRIVLAHEFAHILRRDWVLLIGAELLRSVYWFNPVVWLGCSRLRHESEQACDDAVLSLDIEPSSYARQLVELARSFRAQRHEWLPAAAIARPSSLERRVTAMLNRQMNRQPVTRPAAAAVLAVFVVLTASIAGFEAFAQARFATVSGTVVDQTGGVVPDAILVLSNIQTAAKNEVRTNQTGFFELVGIPAGNYEIEARRPAFRTLNEKISIGVGENIQKNFSMRIASVQEEITVTSAPTTRPLTVEARTLPKRSRCDDPSVGGCVVPPVKVKDVRPIYPLALADSGVEGVVVLEAVLAADGKTKEVRVISSPHPGLDKAAVDAVSAWEFLPTTLNNSEIDTPMTVTVNFRQPSATAK